MRFKIHCFSLSSKLRNKLTNVFSLISVLFRFVLEAVTSKLVINEAGNLEPSSVEVAQVLSLFVYLVSQPSIKAAFLELINSR